MKVRVAIVDTRPDLLDFLKETLEARGFAVDCCLTEQEAEALRPAPDVVLVDFERQVDLGEVLQAIKDGLAG